MGFSGSKNIKNEKRTTENKNNNNKFCGKGKLYNKNTDEIVYEGDLINGICEGKGKYIFENGDYYIGQFKNGLRDGLGKQYYKNKQLQYDGMWKCDMRNEHGIYYYENGDYFIGFWKDNQKVGKGELYNKNREIIKQGDVGDMNNQEKNISIVLDDLILK